MRDLIAVDARNSRSRVVLAAAVIFALVFGWFAVRWQLGSMIADLTLPGDANASQAAAAAAALAPADPVASWLQAKIQTDATSPDHKNAAIRLFEETVRLSPGDYRWRIELARGYEQVEKNDLAEIEFKRAVDLAPAYAFARWHLGNFYLRRGRTDEAFAELRKAAENNQTYREQVFSLAWDYFDKDPGKIEQLAADTPDSRAALALFFAARGRATDSLRIWNLLSDEEKAANPQTAKAIALGLFIQRFFPQALEFARQLGIDADARPEAVTNGDLERGIGAREDSRFDWQISRNDPRLEVAADSSVRHGGARSLKVTFRNYLRPELYNTFQTIVVEPNKTYHLSFWVRAENLKSSGGPLLQVVDANHDKLIAASKAFQTGTHDWENYSVDFKTPESCNGITIRTARVFCGDQCPIAGIFWYDDFELSRQ